MSEQATIPEDFVINKEDRNTNPAPQADSTKTTEKTANPSPQDTTTKTAEKPFILNGKPLQLSKEEINPTVTPSFTKTKPSQSWSKAIVNSLGQIGVGGAIGKTEEGLGSLLNLVSGTNSIDKADLQYRSFLDDLKQSSVTAGAIPGTDSEQNVKSALGAAGTYLRSRGADWQQKAEQAFPIDDNGSSLNKILKDYVTPIGSYGIGLLVPDAAVIEGLEGASKLLGLGKAVDRAFQAGKITAKGAELLKSGTNALSVGALNTHISSSVMAMDSYENTLKQVQDKIDPETGVKFTSEKAKKIAEDGAESVYNYNLANFALNVVGASLLLKPINYAARGAVMSGARAVATDFAKALPVGAASGAVMYVANAEGQHKAMVEAGVEPESKLTDRMANYATSGDMYAQAATMALIGGLQIATTKAVVGKYDPTTIHESAQRAEEIKSRGEFFSHMSSLYDEAAKNGDTVTANFVKDQISYKMGERAAKQGNIRDLKSWYESLQNLTPEQALDLKDQTGFEVSPDMLKHLSKFNEDLSEIEKLHNEGINKYGTELGSIYAENKFLGNKLREKKTQLESDRFSEESKLSSTLNDLSPTGRTLFDISVKEEALKKQEELNSNLRETLKARGLPDDHPSFEQLNKSDEDIAQLKNFISKEKDKAAKSDRTVAEKLTDDDIIKTTNKQSLVDNDVKQYALKQSLALRDKVLNDLDTPKVKEAWAKKAEDAKNGVKQPRKEEPIKDESAKKKEEPQKEDTRHVSPEDQQKVNNVKSSVTAEPTKNPILTKENFSNLKNGEKVTVESPSFNEDGSKDANGLQIGTVKDGKIVFDNETSEIDSSIYNLPVLSRPIIKKIIPVSSQDQEVKNTQESINSNKVSSQPTIPYTENVPYEEISSHNPDANRTWGLVRSSHQEYEPQRDETGIIENKNGFTQYKRDKGSLVQSKMADEKDENGDPKYRFDVMNSTEMHEGKEIRLSVDSTNKLFKELKDSNILTHQNIPIKIETLHNGKWVIINQLRDVRDGETSLLDDTGKGVEALERVRSDVFNDWTQMGDSHQPLYTKVTRVRIGKVHNLKNEDGSHAALTLDYEKGLINGKVVLAIGNSGKFDFVNGDFSLEKIDMSNYTPWDGVVYQIIPAPGGTFYPVHTNGRSLTQDEISKAISILTDNTTPLDAMGWSALSDKINDIVYIGNKTMHLEDSKKFRVDTVKGGLQFGNTFVPFVDGVIKLNDSQTNNLREFLSQRYKNVVSHKLNQPDYNNQLVNDKTITTDVNPQQPFYNTSIEMDSSLSTQREEASKSVLAEKSKPVKTSKLAEEFLGNVGDFGKFKIIQLGSLVPENDQVGTNWVKVAAWIDKHIPGTPLSIVKTLAGKGGRSAWGMVRNRAITLAEGAPTRTAYHEAYHIVKDNCLTDKELNDLYIDSQKRWGENDASKLDELEADAFSDFINSDGAIKPPKGATRNIFQKLWDFIKNLLFGKRLNIDDLFEQMKSEPYAGRAQREVENEVKFREVGDFSAEAQDQIVRNMDYMFFRAVQRRKAFGEDGQINGSEVYSDIKKVFEELYTKTSNNEFQKIIENFDGFVKEHQKYLIPFGYDFKTLDDNGESYVGNPNEQPAEYEKLSTLSDPKQSMSSDMKQYFRLLPDIIDKSTEEGVVKYEPRKSYIGLPLPVNFNYAYSLFKGALANSLDEKSMLANLQELANANPLAAKVLNDYETGSDKFKGQFKTQMAQILHEFVTVVRDGANTRIFDTNRNTLHQEITSEWKNSFYLNNSYVKFGESGVLEFNTKDLKQLSEAYNRRLKSIHNDVSEKNKLFVKSTLNSIGINISDAAVLKASQPVKIKGRPVSGGANFKQLFSNTGSGSVGYMLDHLSSGIDIFSGNEGTLSTIKNLAKLESSVQSDRFSHTFTDGQGNKVYAINAPNMLAKTILGLKTDTENALQKYMTSPIINPTPGDDSMIAPWFRNLKENSKTRDILNVKSIDVTRKGNSRTGYEDWSPKQYLDTSVSMFLNSGAPWGYFMEPSPSDKTKIYTIAFPKVAVQRVNGKLSGQAVDDIMQTVHGEIARITRCEADLQNLTEDQLVDTYHFHPDTKNKKDRSGRGFKFNFFPQLNEIPELYDNDKKGLVNEGQTIDKDTLLKVRNEVINFLEERVKETKKNFLKYSFIREDKGKLVNANLDAKAFNSFVGDTDFKIKQLIDQYAVNRVLGLAEMTKMLMVDLAYTKNFLDTSKRWPFSHTPGVEPRIGKGGMDSDFTTSIVHDVLINLPEDQKVSIKDGLKVAGLKDSEIEDVLKPFKDINSTDSQVYISSKRYQNIMDGTGQKSDIHETLKDLVAGLEVRNGTLMPSYVKCSSKELSTQVTQGNPILEDLRKRMNAEGKYENMKPIDTIIFSSASKLGISGAGNLKNLDKLIVSTISGENYRIPQVNPTKDSVDTPLSTQLMKLILGNIHQDEKYTVGSTKLQGEEVVNRLNKLMGANMLNSSKQLHDELGLSTIKSLKEQGANITMGSVQYLNRSISEHIRDVINDSRIHQGTDDSQDRSLDLDKEGNPPLPWWFPTYGDSNEAAILSPFRNQIIKQTMPGFSGVQFSDYGVAPDLKPTLFKDGKVIPAEFYVSPSFFINTLKRLGADIETFKDINGNLDINKFEKVIKGIGQRIPTQDKSSMFPSQIVKFSPESAGNCVTGSAMLLKQTGADLDNDKYIMYFPDFYLDAEDVPTPYEYDLDPNHWENRWSDYKKQASKDKTILKALKETGISRNSTQEEIDKIFSFNTALKNNMEKTLGTGQLEGWTVALWDSLSAHLTETEFKTLTPEQQLTPMARKNAMLDVFKGILTDPKHYGEMISSNTTDHEKKSLRDMRRHQTDDEGKRLSGDLNYNWLNEDDQSLIADSNMNSSKLRGTFSLHSVNHAVLTSSKEAITIKSTSAPLFDGKEYSNLKGIEDEQGRLISKNLMETQTTSLDSAKEPTAALLNFNTLTGNVKMLLSRVSKVDGKGLSMETVNLFLNQPVIQKWVDMVKTMGNTSSNIARAYNSIATNYVSKIQQLAKNDSYTFDIKKGELFDMRAAHLKLNLAKQETAAWYKAQLEVLSTFLNFKTRAARDLDNIINAMRIDDHRSSGPLGATSDHFKFALEKIDNILNGNSSISGAEQFYKEGSSSYFKAIVDHALQPGVEFINTIFPWGKDTFTGVQQQLSTIGLPTTLRPEIRRQVNQKVLLYFFNHPTSPFHSTPQDMGRLLKGKSSVAYRVEKIKEFLDKMKISNPSFEIPTFFREIKAEIQVADEHGVANVNVLKGFQFLKSARITKRTAVEKNAILRSFKDISHNGIKGFTEGQNETVKQLLDDYVQYVVVTSGFGYSDQSLLQSIPIEYLLEKGMGEFAKFADQNLFNDPSSSEGVLDQIIRHDFADSSMNRIVPEVTIGRKGGIDVVLPTYTNGTVTTFKVNPTVSSALYSERGYPKYTKMADSGGTLHLYKFKGYSDLESTIGNYEMEESLGIPNKFFEYQFGSNPKSIVPANKVLDFQPLEVLRTDKIETENSAQQLLGISKEEFSYYVKEVQKGNIPDSIKEKIKDVVLPTDDGKTQYTSAFRTWDLGKMAGTPETAESTKKLDDFIINHPDRSVDGGESFNTFRDRVLSEFQTQLEQAPDNATIVTHNSVLGLMKLWDKMGRPELGKGQQESKGINFQEDQTFGYRERTIKNASADATVAIAHDFNSAGERLTKGSVLAQKKLYLPVPTSSFSSESSINAYAGRIASELNKLPNNEISLNIAGNGIYTLKGTLTQGAADNFTFELLAKVIQRLNPEKHITSLRTGGQTGFDEAGAKAGLKLGIPTLILAPKGWKFRNISGQDISSEQKFKSRFPQAPESKNIDKEFVEAYVQQSTQTGEVAEFKSNNGTLFVARHGETEDNLKGNYRNDTTKLTSKGIEEAKQVGEKLKDKNISQIISSDLPRAKFTASLLRSKQDLNFKTKGFDTDKKLSNDVLSALKGLIAKANYGLNGLDIVDLQRKYNNDIVAVTNHTEKLVEFAANEEGLAALPEETTHVFSTFVRHTPMYTELKKLARDSQYYEDVISNPIYQQEFGNIKDNEEKYASEAADKLIADDIFRKGDSIMKESKSFWAKVKALINRMWEWFKGKARRNQDAVQAWKQQVSDITEKYARDILTGNISGEGVGSGLSMKVRAKTPLEFFLDKQIRFQEANIEKLESLIAKEISSGQTDPSRHEKTLENTRLFLTKLQEAVDAKGNVEQNKQFLMNMNKAERLLTELNNRVAEGNITKNQLNDAYSVTDAYIDANQALSPEVAGELKDKANSVSAKALELSLKLKDLVDNHVTELVNTLTTDPQFKESSYNSLDPVEDLSWVQTNLYPARNVPNTLIQITHKLGYKCVKNEEESFNALKLVILQSFDKLTAFKGTVDLVQLSEDFIQKDANGVPNGRFVDQKSDTFLKAIKDNYKRLKDESDEDYKKRIVLWKKNNLKTKSNYQEIKDNMKRILGEQGYRKWFFANHTMNEDDHGNVRYYVGVDLQESKDKIKYPDDAKWAKINSTSALKEFYNDYTGHWALGDTMGSAKYKMGNKLASLSAGIIELIRTNGIGPALRSVKNEIIEALSFKVKQEDSNDELQAEVPITFTPRKPKSGNLSDHKLKANLKSVDLKNGLLTYLQERHLEKALRQVKEDCELISRHIKNNRVIKTNLRGKNPTFEVGSKSNLDKRYDGLMHELMGTSKEPTVILKMNINKLMSLVMETTGIINLGFNYTAAAHRFALGTLMGGSEAYAGTYFNTKDFMKAGAMMMSKPYSHVLKTLMKEYEIAQFTKYFIKGNNERSVASSLAGKVFSRDVFYFFHSELEFYLQSRQVLAKLIHVQHDGKSFIDHLRVQNGVIVPKEGSSLTKDQMYNEIYKAKGLMTNIHGNSNEKSPFQLHTATGPIFQHKSWLPAGISNSWSDRHYEESLGDSTGGYSKTLYTFILGDIARINAFKHKLDFNDPSVRRDFSRAMFIWASRVGVALASMLVADYIKNSQDVEVPFTGGTTKNEILSATRYVMDKTVLDLEFFDPIGFWDAAYNTFLNPQKSPLPLLGFLKEATDLVQRAALEIRNLAFHDVPAKDLMYSKNEYGHHVGDRKIMTSVKKLLGPLSPDNRIKRVAEVENKKK